MPNHPRSGSLSPREVMWTCVAVLALTLLLASSPASANITITPLCALNSANRSVTICTPGPSATVSLPVHLVASTTDSTQVTAITVLVDGKPIYQASASAVDVYLNSLTAGAHVVAVKAQDSAGTFSQTLQITVTANVGLNNIRHIIYYVQENHSFDNYFGMLGPYRVSKGLSNNVDGLNLNIALNNTQGKPVHPYHLQTVCMQGLTPFWNQAYLSVDGGNMDKFLNTGGSTQIDPTTTRAMGYYDQSDLPYYYELATQFATSDRFFSPVLSNSNPNRMYLFAGTSFGHIRPDPPPTGGWTQATIFDHLDQAGVSWRYYYQDKGIYLPQWSTYQRDASKLKPIANWYTDIQNESALPSVIFIERAGPSGLDEHPANNIQKGAANTAKILNALLSSPSWGSSIFILTYDEGGGSYDHVIPATAVAPDSIPPMLRSSDAQGDFGHDGFRVPVIIISPWVKPHLVSHTWRDYTSILRLIETRFNVQSLTARDAAADNMIEFFDFTQASWLTPPPLPAQPTTGTCNVQLEKAPGF